MITLQNIFDKMKGDWDWFGKEKNKEKYGFWAEKSLKIGNILGSDKFSLPDLLSNKSWCKSVWGESGYYTGAKFTGIKTMEEAYDRVDEFRLGLHFECSKEASVEAFQILQQQGKQACIDYIYKTML